MKGYIIKYLWKTPNERPIEMMGLFTEKRWEQFKKHPHPTRRDVTVAEVSRQFVYLNGVKIKQTEQV